MALCDLAIWGLNGRQSDAAVSKKTHSRHAAYFDRICKPHDAGSIRSRHHKVDGI